MAAPFREFKWKRTGRTYTVTWLPNLSLQKLQEMEESESKFTHINWYDLPTPKGQTPLPARGVYLSAYRVTVDNDPKWEALVSFRDGELVSGYRQVVFAAIAIVPGGEPITDTALPLDDIRRAALQMGAVFGLVYPPGHSVPGICQRLPDGCTIQKLSVGEFDVHPVDIAGLTGRNSKLRIYDPQSLREVLELVEEHKRLKTTGVETRSQLIYVSEATGRPENTVAKMIKRARKDLREHEPQTITTTKKSKTKNVRTKRPAKAVQLSVGRKHELIKSGRKRK